MDEAYQQHSPHIRRHNKSSTSLNSLSLAPLTSRLPIDDAEISPSMASRPRSPRAISYIEHRHVGPNPGVLSHPNSRSTSRVSHHRRKLSLPEQGQASNMKKSKSSTQLQINPAAANKVPLRHKSGAMTPGPRPSHGKHAHKLTFSEDISLLFSPVTREGHSRDEDDWLLRTGALMTYGARETKGQTWLVTRDSSTSMTAHNRDDDSDLEDEAHNHQIGSRRGSGDTNEEFFSTVTTRSFIAHNGSRTPSHYNSRFNSRSVSRAVSRNVSRRGSRAGPALTPSQREAIEAEGYFDDAAIVDVIEDEGEDLSAQAAADEQLIRRLVKTGTLGLGTWVERLMGWSLFAVDDDMDDDKEDDGDETEKEEEWQNKMEMERQHWREMLEKEARDQGVQLPPPPKDSEGGWSDVAWLLSVATKVLL